MIQYLINNLEAFSQCINTIHGGDANQTFSARVASYRGADSHWYWSGWIWLFETFWPGHLDWASGPDTPHE